MKQATNLYLHRQANKFNIFCVYFGNEIFEDTENFRYRPRGSLWSVPCGDKKRLGVRVIYFYCEKFKFFMLQILPNIVIEVTANVKTNTASIVAICYPISPYDPIARYIYISLLPTKSSSFVSLIARISIFSCAINKRSSSM